MSSHTDQCNGTSVATSNSGPLTPVSSTASMSCYLGVMVLRHNLSAEVLSIWNVDLAMKVEQTIVANHSATHTNFK